MFKKCPRWEVQISRLTELSDNKKLEYERLMARAMEEKRWWAWVVQKGLWLCDMEAILNAPCRVQNFEGEVMEWAWAGTCGCERFRVEKKWKITRTRCGCDRLRVKKKVEGGWKHSNTMVDFRFSLTLGCRWVPMSWDAVWARWEGKRSYMVEERECFSQTREKGPS